MPAMFVHVKLRFDLESLLKSRNTSWWLASGVLKVARIYWQPRSDWLLCPQSRMWHHAINESIMTWLAVWWWMNHCCCFLARWNVFVFINWQINCVLDELCVRWIQFRWTTSCTVVWRKSDILPIHCYSTASRPLLWYHSSLNLFVSRRSSYCTTIIINKLVGSYCYEASTVLGGLRWSQIHLKTFFLKREVKI